jgi:hypothetical protein
MRWSRWGIEISWTSAVSPTHSHDNAETVRKLDIEVRVSTTAMDADNFNLLTVAWMIRVSNGHRLARLLR